ncbi:MAG: RsmD family RNA methyltransferase [Bacteroidales bacterium]
MRIVSGLYRGRILQAPQSFKLRPTTDKAKESLFNILNNEYDFDNIRILDLFAGIGSISFESASRGCEYVVSVEKNSKHARFIHIQKENLKIDTIHVVCQDVRLYLQMCDESYDVIFADPPYELPWIDDLPGLIFQSSVVSHESVVIIEHSSQTSFEKHPQFSHTRRYGKVHFSWFVSDKV